jgi:hypothetical protein
MTREHAKKMLPIISAFAEGKTVQHRTGEHCPWSDHDTPSFSAPPENYRIAPEPKPRKWKPEEVPIGALIKGADRCAPQMPSIILTVNDDDLIYCDKSCTLQKYSLFGASRDLVYSKDGAVTWHPCGVLES